METHYSTPSQEVERKHCNEKYMDEEYTSILSEDHGLKFLLALKGENGRIIQLHPVNIEAIPRTIFILVSLNLRLGSDL